MFPEAENVIVPPELSALKFDGVGQNRVTFELLMISNDGIPAFTEYIENRYVVFIIPGTENGEGDPNILLL